MAKPDEILLKLEIQESKVRDKIDKLKESVSKLDGRKREYKRTVKELQLEEQKLSKIRDKRISRQKQLANSTKELTKETQRLKVLRKIVLRQQVVLHLPFWNLVVLYPMHLMVFEVWQTTYLNWVLL